MARYRNENWIYGMANGKYVDVSPSIFVGTLNNAVAIGPECMSMFITSTISIGIRAAAIAFSGVPTFLPPIYPAII
ncbi:MAG: hypothetical protein DRN20_02905 [Thermoplasmata archaeon]|nr:MAG: hypothetical protein DRN20_02905 [Thermoplasmata archaeon]